MEVGCQGYRRTDGEGLIGVWYTADGRLFVLVPGTNVVVLRRQLASCVTEPLEGAWKMGTAGEYLGKRRIG